ncbi:enoyl-CoA hydratase/isomerase family protein [Paenactinomyces guangxiensis]|uniref:Enoyl-CoA hydratase/isomerase family protein n=1 Tax=Paenactinomyces guangxiensis TaxID=1490290 RepID=A0A7W2A8F2_9BACL|nr:enoyl-CoA hydratase-related protein [Paenactinomyces guangxiensis]MBA4495556.1 enoyl-CoA hydratase/isomerase family protein [Paenactinomyces guangxiensis]MBH8592814.1 enoyl-CoA hydratase/isomerase family protein [Paenactinomyces guangxiensis]
MKEKHCQVQIRGRVVIITIHRPPLNTLSRDTLYELETVLDETEENDSIGSLIITGDGEKMFSAGADISEFAEMADQETAEKALRRVHDLFNRIESFPKPVIACVNGKALGGGNELQMACHLAIAADTAEFALPEIRLGIIPGYGGTQRLPRIIGRRRSLDLMLSGRPISAQTAFEIGLVNRVVPQKQVRDAAIQWAEQLAAGPPVAIKGILDAATRGTEQSLCQGLEIERENMLKVIRTEDAIEGVTAFFSKRPPSFQGR